MKWSSSLGTGLRFWRPRSGMGERSSGVYVKVRIDYVESVGRQPEMQKLVLGLGKKQRPGLEDYHYFGV